MNAKTLALRLILAMPRLNAKRSDTSPNAFVLRVLSVMVKRDVPNLRPVALTIVTVNPGSLALEPNALILV